MNTKEVIKPALVLLIIASVAAAALGAVQSITAEPIRLQEEQTRAASMQAVMPDASSFEEITDLELTGSLTAVYKADNGGFVITAAPGGFGGAVNTMVGIDTDGVITGLRVTKHAETPGLGAKSTDPSFYEQFTGMSGTLAVTKDGGEVIPITSSTITSRAVTSGANEALEWFAANGGAY
ncbi:electron transport complex subunit RsxG [Anaerotignum neopropionicum]|uniref:Ion-translocating oxidoreductase complex subunit G n=1 Tax=Anaerotignum neopropionicum TaxID=36847 RepID=A0A136WHN6_9FIRM|nr:RnfABCDGE type electron transport complex subunit G [Anaerotignum neopropionicum]KXL54041.1 electron transport complex subunit RsxG [Anaerotignum neopropionicum]